MTRVRLLREAAEELSEASEFYEAQKVGLGLAFLAEVRRARIRIRERPLACKIERGEVRARAIARFPYRILYSVRDEEILILAIAHRRRRPGFWRPRVQDQPAP